MISLDVTLLKPYYTRKLKFLPTNNNCAKLLYHIFLVHSVKKKSKNKKMQNKTQDHPAFCLCNNLYIFDLVKKKNLYQYYKWFIA